MRNTFVTCVLVSLHCTLFQKCFPYFSHNTCQNDHCGISFHNVSQSNEVYLGINQKDIFVQCNSYVFWNHTWQSAQWRALCTKISEVIFDRMVHEDSP